MLHVRTHNRAALLISFTAVIISTAALWAAGAAVATHRAAPPLYPLVCGQGFTDARTGRTVPMYVPCSSSRP